MSTYPCRVCIRMIGDTCKTHGCMHDRFLEGNLVDCPAAKWWELDELSAKQALMFGEPKYIAHYPKPKKEE